MTEPYSINLVDPWRAQAACRGMDANWFHPVRGGSVAAQREVCAGCPVKADCLQYALDNNINVGIYGGTTDKDRRKIKRGITVRMLTFRCAYCDDVFERPENAKGSHQKYCSRPCRDHANYERRRLAS